MIYQETPSLLNKRIKIGIVLISIALGLWFVYTVRGVLAPFALAFILAYVLTPLVDRMEGRGLNRTSSILLIFLGVFTVLILGLVTAGKKLTDEMVDLSVEFLRQDSVVGELAIKNNRGKPVSIQGEWRSQSRNSPFAIVNPEQFPVVIGAGEQHTLTVRFAPTDTKPARARFRISTPNTKEAVVIRMQGNHMGSRHTYDDVVTVPFLGDSQRDPVTWAGITLSAGGLDFGNAGPNVVTRVSSLARLWEPYFQSYLGPDTDIAQLVKDYGSSLIAVMLGEDTDLVGSTKDLLGGIFSGIVLVVIVPFVAFFFLREGRRITHNLIELIPNSYFELCLNLIHQINGQIGAYIRGQLLAVSVVATLAVTGLSLIGVPYALPVGVLAGLSNMIPYLGPLIGIAVASVVALATLGGLSMVIKIVAVFLIIQLIDNIFVQPVVIAKSVDLHPLMVLVVVMIGSDLGQIIGMLVAVPLTGIIKVSSVTIYEGLKGYRGV